MLIGSGATALHGVEVHCGAVVGAGAVLPDGLLVPPGALAVGVPARIKLDAVTRDFITDTVAMYVANADRYKSEMREITWLPLTGSTS